VSLSVIVASYNSHQTLQRCLQSLSEQPEAQEIVVADCSEVNPTEQLGRLFPRVRFLHFQGKRSVPQLRWAAYEQTRNEIVAATEARCVPSRDWCAQLLRAHKAAPEAPAVAGPIIFSSPASAFDVGLYFCEYGMHCPPTTESEVRLASGANISYKRAALEQSRDLLEAGTWETLLHQRWISQGHVLRMSSALVLFENTMNPSTAFRQRFHYGRGYAADRVSRARWFRRLVYASFCPVLPALMTWRLARVAWRKARMKNFQQAVHWIILLSCAWSLGEVVGYLMGKSAEQKIF